MDEIFKKNLEALRRFHPSVYLRLQTKIDSFQKSDLETTDAAESLLEKVDLSNASSVFFLGFGNAEILEKFMALRPSNNFAIAVIEKNADSFLNVLSKKDLSSYFENPDIAWCIDDDLGRLTHFLIQFFTRFSTVSRFFKMIALPSALRNSNGFYEEVSHQMLEARDQATLRMGNSVPDTLRGFHNTIENLDLAIENPGFASLIKRFPGKVAISLAAGPSLNEHWETIRALQGRVAIFACDTLLKPLSDRGIAVDFITAVERDPIVTDFFRGVDVPKRTSLIAPTLLLKSSFDEFKGEHFIYCSDSPYYRALGLDYLHPLYPGHSAGNLNIAAALQMGFSTIIMVGHNLAFAHESGESHVSGTIDPERECPKTVIELRAAYGDYRVKSQDGSSELQTRMEYDLFRKEIEDLIAVHSDIRFINTALKGARIAGAETLELNEAVRICVTEDFDLDPFKKSSVPKIDTVEKSKRAQKILSKVLRILAKIEKYEQETDRLLESFPDWKRQILEAEKNESPLDIKNLNLILDQTLNLKVHAVNDDSEFNESCLGLMSASLVAFEREINEMPGRYRSNYELKRDFIFKHEGYYRVWKNYFPTIRAGYEKIVGVLKTKPIVKSNSNEILQKNWAAIQTHQPDLFKMLEADYLKFGSPLPIEEKEETPLPNQSGTLVLFYGMGSGKSLENFLQTRTLHHYLVCLIEKDPQKFLSILSERDFSRYLADPSIVWIVSSDQDFMGSYFQIVPTRHPTACKIPLEIGDDPSYAQLRQQIARQLARVDQAYGDSIEDQMRGLKNAVDGLHESIPNPGFKKLENQWNGPIISVASGPSLTENLDLLRELQDRIPIIACDTAFPKLLSEGIIPDFVTALERDAYVTNCFKEIEIPSKTTLIASTVLLKEALEAYRGSKALYSDFNRFHSVFQLDELGILLPGHSAGNLNIAAACKMGFDQIILVGHNLAFALDNLRSHYHGIGDERDQGQSLEDLKAKKKNIWSVKTQDGLSEVMTDQNYDLFRIQIEFWVNQLKDKKFINTAAKGAKIEGAHYHSLKEIALSNLKSNFSSDRKKEVLQSLSAAVVDDRYRKAIQKTERIVQILKGVSLGLKKISNVLDKQMEQIALSEKRGSKISEEVLDQILDIVLDFKVGLIDDVDFQNSFLSVIYPLHLSFEKDFNAMPSLYSDNYSLKKDAIRVHREHYFKYWEDYLPPVLKEFERALKILKARPKMDFPQNSAETPILLES